MRLSTSSLDFNPLSSDSTGRGVAPVIGTVVMVVAAVAIAVTLGAYALSAHPSSHSAPQTTFSCTGSGSSWTVKMTTGHSIPTAQLTSDGHISHLNVGGDNTMDSGDRLTITGGSKLIRQTNGSSTVLTDCAS